MFIKSAIFAVLAMFSVSAFAVKDVQKPQYEFDFDAPRVVHVVTPEVCEQVGINTRWISTGISGNLSNRQIKEQLFIRASKDKNNTSQLVAITLLSDTDVIESIREFETGNDYRSLARKYPEYDRHQLHGLTGQVRCTAIIGKTVDTAKVVRVNKVVM